MWNWIVNLFKKKNLLMCGGEGLCEIVVKGKVCGTIRYRRPTSNEKLDYTYQLQKELIKESKLKEISETKDDKAKKCHEILLRDISIPMARKIFICSSGFFDNEGKSIDNIDPGKQFEIIMEYYGYVLYDFCEYAYAAEGIVKKKY